MATCAIYPFLKGGRNRTRRGRRTKSGLMVRMLAPRVRAADLAVVRLPPKAADPYYLTLERDGGVCTIPGCGRQAVVADHIVARKAGGADALHNTRSLCRLHDNRFRERPTRSTRRG
jgi:hypothetical protein